MKTENIKTVSFCVSIPNREGTKVARSFYIPLPVREDESGETIVTPEGHELIERVKVAEILADLCVETRRILLGVDLAQGYVSADIRKQLERVLADIQYAQTKRCYTLDRKE